MAYQMPPPPPQFFHLEQQLYVQKVKIANIFKNIKYLY